MKLRSLEIVLRALQAANVKYLVAGGVAVNAYGYQRLTQDLDLVIGLRPDNVLRGLLKNEALAPGPHWAAPCGVLSRARSAATSAPCVLALRVPSVLPWRGVILQQPLRALKVLSRLGYRPIVPADIEEFADAEKREEWIEHKNMQVFSLESDTYRDTTVDVFAKEPFDFEAEYAAAELHELTPGVQLPLVRLSTLIAMKRHADRPIDQDDVKHLSWILDERDAETLDEP